MSDNLADNLSDTAGRHGDRTAFKLDDFELSYTGLDGAASRIANLLQDKGLEPGDRVGLMLPNVPYFPAIYYAPRNCGQSKSICCLPLETVTTAMVASWAMMRDAAAAATHYGRSPGFGLSERVQCCSGAPLRQIVQVTARRSNDGARPRISVTNTRPAQVQSAIPLPVMPLSFS